LELAKTLEEEAGIRVDCQIVPADPYFNVLQSKLNTDPGPVFEPDVI
jgi:raffinose/stachyose/melibiose transport system substrate-binding protein